MIKEISFKNYKAFKKGRITIKPITVLLGANSVGKSSIIQLLLMLQQTATTDKYKSALKLHGEYVSLGENENIFHNKNTKNGLVLTFQFVDPELLHSFKAEFLERQVNLFVRTLSIFNHYTLGKKNKGKRITSKKIKRIINQENSISRNDFLFLVEYVFSLSKEFKGISENKADDEEWAFISRYELPPIFSTNQNKNISEVLSDYSNLYDLLKKTSFINSDRFELSFKIENIKTVKGSILKVTQVCLSNDSNTILDLSLTIDKKKSKYENIVLKSAFLKKQNLFNDIALKELLTTVNYDSTLFYLFSSHHTSPFNYGNNQYSGITNFVNNIFSESIDNLKKAFTKEMINYVSPLRAHPKRYYFLDKAKINTFLDTLDGDSLTEILKENNTVKTKVNNWLKRFDLSVDVDTLEDVIHKLKINQNNLSLDITDVGFGISQILPVIVQGFLSYKGSLTIIEQPEIHLHPKMQADLADLFIDIALSTKKNHPTKFLIIETHSEYLLKRLRRRMAEKKHISSDSVAIYFFHPKDENCNATIKEKKINEDGAFEWPKNFYSGELLEDTIEFIKNQRY